MGLRETVYGFLEESLVWFTWPTNEEECGVIVWHTDAKRLELLSVPNRHEDPRHSMLMWQSDVDDVLRGTTGTLVAVFHTHIERDNILPSEHDHQEIGRLRTRSAYRHCYGVVFHNRTKTVSVYNERGVIHSYVATVAQQ